MIDVDTRIAHACRPPDRCDEAARGRWRCTVGAATIAVALSGCSSWSSLTGGSSTPPPEPTPTPSTSSTASPPPASNTSFTSRVKSFFTGGSSNAYAAAPQTVPGASASPDINCPSVDYRQGAATMAVNAPGSDNAALGLRYQASFVQTARECAVRGNDLTIKVGVQGRIVVGPAGGPGQISIPLRYALVREGLEPRTLWTKLFMVPVAIADSQLNLPWIHVEEEMTVPLPPADEIESYVIYIGFDPDGVAPPKPARPAAKPKPRTR
jgi:hypothetical protein